MKKFKKEKGITLVALIITIVVLLILAMVTIGAVQDSNLIAHAQNAAGSFNQAKNNEITLLEKYEKEIEDKLPKIEEIMWGEYQGMLMYIGTSNDLKVTSDTIKVQEITVNEETMEYAKVEGTIKMDTFSDYETIIFILTPNIKTIDFGGKLSSIDQFELSGLDLEEVKGLDGITEIRALMFAENKKLKEIIIPEGVTFIGDHAFENCSALEKITIPSTVTSFETGTFTGCTSLTDITINNKKENFDLEYGAAGGLGDKIDIINWIG